MTMGMKLSKRFTDGRNIIHTPRKLRGTHIESILVLTSARSTNGPNKCPYLAVPTPQNPEILRILRILRVLRVQQYATVLNPEILRAYSMHSTTAVHNLEILRISRCLNTASTRSTWGIFSDSTVCSQQSLLCTIGVVLEFKPKLSHHMPGARYMRTPWYTHPYVYPFPRIT